MTKTPGFFMDEAIRIQGLAEVLCTAVGTTLRDDYSNADSIANAYELLAQAAQVLADGLREVTP